MHAKHPSPASPDAPEARGVLASLLALSLVRGIAGLLPSMWMWGVDAQRFLSPAAAWGPWLLSLTLSIPAVARPLSTRFAPAAEWFAHRRWTTLLVSLGAGFTVWSLPDRTWITGDFMLRQGWAEAGAYAENFSNALPLELLLNRTLPRLVDAPSQIDPNLLNRAIDAIAAAVLAALALELAREWRFSGAARAVAAAAIFSGGYLCVFTGLGKPSALLCVLVVAALLGATRLVKSGRGGVMLGLSVGVAVLLHRSSLMLIPLWLGALAMARPIRGSHSRRARWSWSLALLLPLGPLAIAAPRIARTFWEFDLPRHLTPVSVRSHGMMSATLGPLHLIDLANLLLLYMPALIPAGVVLFRRPRGEVDVRDLRLIGLLALSAAPILLFIHPIQGTFRDLEVFAAVGVVAGLIAAHALGGAIQSGRVPGWWSPALTAAVLLPTLQWMILFHDPRAGLSRARAFAVEAPARTDDERAQMWDVIAYRAIRLHAWDLAVEASEHCVQYAPHERAYLMLAITRTYASDYRGAMEIYDQMSRRYAEDPLVWVGLGGVALRLGDSLQIARVRERLYSYPQGSPESRRIRTFLRVYPEVWPANKELAGERPP